MYPCRPRVAQPGYLGSHAVFGQAQWRAAGRASHLLRLGARWCFLPVYVVRGRSINSLSDLYGLGVIQPTVKHSRETLERLNTGYSRESSSADMTWGVQVKIGRLTLNNLD